MSASAQAEGAQTMPVRASEAQSESDDSWAPYADSTIAGQATAQGLTGEERAQFILERMTTEEKLGQLHQMAGGRSKNLNSRIDDGEYERVRNGLVGSYLHVAGAGFLKDLQRVAVEESRHGVPLLFAMDVVHGYRTILPVPLAMAASFDDDLAEEGARVAGREASAAGLHWTFAPMVDISRDPRWGRIVEGGGEEPYLGSRMSAAQVRGFQGDDLTGGDTILATAKHFGAYGAGIGGRDYNSADISERTLREVYLPPFYAAAMENAGSFMVAFNDIAGVPTTGNRWLLQELLRGEWDYDGVLLSDWNSVLELINHGVAETRADAGTLALAAGVDMEMTSGIYVADMLERVEGEPDLMEKLNESVFRLLMAKDSLGLFDDPYVYHDTDREAAEILSDTNRAVAREAAHKSMVLLENDGTLPLSPEIGRVAVIGALADDDWSPLGSWRAQGKPEDVKTVLDGIRAYLPEAEVDYVEGAGTREAADDRQIREAVRAARRAEAVVLVIGEDYDLSGEARSRSSIDLPEAQLALAEAVLETNTPVVIVLMNGRPLNLSPIADKAEAVLETWMLGIETGPAVADVLFGAVSPGGKLPVSFPRVTGQAPYYMGHNNTGRPADPDLEKDTARYMDLPITPLYAFGHGLSYSTFDYGDVSQSVETVGEGGTVSITASVTNAGEMTADEVVQLYVRDPLATVARPVQELRGYARVSLAPGETADVTFTLSPEQLGFIGLDGTWTVEPGEIDFMIGSASDDIRQTGSFEITESFTPSMPAAAIPTPVEISYSDADGAPTVGSIETYDAKGEAILPQGTRITRLTEDEFTWSEGPVWIKEGGYLLFTDVPNNIIHKWSEEDGLETFMQPAGYDGPATDVFREPGANGLIRAEEPGSILMADHGNRFIARLDLETQEKTPLAAIYDGMRFSSPNDLVLADDGSIYFTDPPYGLAGIDDSPAKETPFNGVYRFVEAAETGDTSVELIDDELSKPNGIILSPDGGTLYVAQSDPEAAAIYAYDLGADGLPTGRRVFADLTDQVGPEMPGLPDGLAMDTDGNLYATGPGGVRVFSPEGEMLALISTGTAAANVTFGGPDGSTLYITSGSFLARVETTATGLGF